MKSKVKPKVKPKIEVPSIKWLNGPEDHDYPAAISYLSLIYSDQQVQAIVSRLQNGKEICFKAKDIFRASKLSLLGISNSHVKKNLRKIKKGEPMSPLLLVRDVKDGKVIIADGYHRLCAVYQRHEDISIPCKITGIKM